MVDEKEMVGVNDDLGTEIAERQLESLKEQLVMYEKSIERSIKEREDYIEQCEVDETVWQIRLKDGNHEKLEDKKQFKYELDPKYWEMVRKKAEYEYRNHRSAYDSTLKRFERTLDELNKSKESVEEKITALTEE
jgi:hypothetical protein